MYDKPLCDDCIHIRIASDNDIYNPESAVRLLFCSQYLYSFDKSICNRFINSIAVSNTFFQCIAFNSSICVLDSIADADTVPTVVPGSHGMLPQFT